MPQIKFKEVLSYSSEDPNNPADNLLRPETFRKWKCAPNKSEKQSFIILKFDHLTSINSLDIGNDGSALIEVLVSREGLNDYELLLVSSAFMTPAESRNETDLNRVRMFGPDKLNKNVAEQKWDRMKVICTQPFNTRMQFGLCFITARCVDSEKQESSQPVTKLGSFTLKMEDDSNTISIGSMFAKRKEKTSLPVTGPAAIRAASRNIGGAASPVVTPKRKDPQSDGGSSQLKKKTATESIRSPIPKDPPSTSSHTPNQNKGKQNERQIKPERTKDKPNPRDSGGKEKKEKSKESRNKKEEKVSHKPSSSTTSETTRKRKSKPFNSLMDDVVFVMSGYQNPERSTLRDKLLEMGGDYRSDWNPGCTHLICAFTNTPKYRQVKGKGRIVTGKWITESFKNKIRYPCRRYGLEKHTGGSESEEEIWAEELLPKVAKPNIKETKETKETTPPKPTNDSDTDLNYSDNEDTDDEIQKVLDRQQIKKQDVASDTEASSSNNYKKDNNESSKERDKAITAKQSVKGGEKERKVPQSTRDRSTSNGHKDSSDDEVYEADTDIDEELPDTSSLPLPILEDYFKGKCFFLYGTMAEKERKLLTRYVIAYNGQIEDYMSEKVNFVLSDSKWDENFEEVLNENPALQFVKVQWIWQCCDKKKLVAYQPFLIVP